MSVVLAWWSRRVLVCRRGHAARHAANRHGDDPPHERRRLLMEPPGHRAIPKTGAQRRCHRNTGIRFAPSTRSGRWDLNPRPTAWEADALPTELRPRRPRVCPVPPAAPDTSCGFHDRFPKPGVVGFESHRPLSKKARVSRVFVASENRYRGDGAQPAAIRVRNGRTACMRQSVLVSGRERLRPRTRRGPRARSERSSRRARCRPAGGSSHARLHPIPSTCRSID